MELTVKDLTKSFGEKQVLSGISFSAQGGKAFGLLGRNGAGKTTTIRIIMQVFNPNSGEVLLDNEPIDLSKVNIGYMPEERGLYPKKQIMDQLIYFASLKGIPKKQAKETAVRFLNRLEMMEYAESRLDTLSKGNQQKIQLVATLVSDPKIVILDEPFSGLDPVNAMLLKDIVRELIAEGKIVLFSSHQMNYIEEFCDDIVIVSKGKIALSGNIREIKRSYDRNKLLVQAENKQALEAILKNGMGDLLKKYSIQNEAYLIELKSADSKSEALKIFAENGIDIDEFKVYEPSLSDIFVDYTEGAI